MREAETPAEVISDVTDDWAFPRAQQIDRYENIVVEDAPGMTLRDYFAAKAMQGAISGAMAQGAVLHGSEQMLLVSEAAYGMADAMLKARQA